MDQPESFPQLVGVLDTNDNFALGMATVALSEAGIVYDIVAIPDLPENLEAEKPKWWIRPTRILVAAEDASEARSLVEPFQTLRSNSDIEASSARELVDAVKPSLIWKGPPDAPFVQRVGARLIGSLFVCFGLIFLYESLKEESPLVGVLLRRRMGVRWRQSVCERSCKQKFKVVHYPGRGRVDFQSPMSYDSNALTRHFN